MARVSRKKPPVSAPAATEAALVWKTALYARLSVEDNGKESDSIENQIAILEAYVKAHPALRRAELYIDNGYTGTNFLRPGFSRMMQDVQAEKINCVVVKDLSRLGRAYIETSEFIEKICPFFGLRFISINDGYDSESAAAEGDLSVSLSNIINDYYAKDISRKVSTALRAKMEKGDYIANYAPYGYIKDPQNKNSLLVDPVAAMIVRQVYLWRCEGMSYMGINRRLNQAGVPSPGQYRLERGIATNNNRKGKAVLWNKHVLTDILSNTVYLGHLAQGKGKQQLYAGIPYYRTSREEWIISRDAHEPIIDAELFERVQQINSAAAEQAKRNFGKYDYLPKEKNVLGKRFTCACCGAVMRLQRSFSTKRDKVYYTYKCPTYAQHGRLGCQDVKMRKGDLDEALLSLLSVQMNCFMDAHAMLKQIEKDKKKKHNGEEQRRAVQKMQAKLEKKRQLLSGLYVDLKEGLFTVEEYKQHKAILGEEIEALMREIAQYAEHPDAEREAIRDAVREQILGYLQADRLTESMVQAFVESVRIDEKGELCVKLAFEDVLLEMIRACGEVA